MGWSVKEAVRRKVAVTSDSQAPPRHTQEPLPLLPSGPDGVGGLPLHGTRLSLLTVTLPGGQT